MVVYSVRSAKHIEPLTASGYPGRWNRQDQKVLYASESRSLASLEWLVSRGGRVLNNDFVLITIQLNISSSDVKILKENELMTNWRSLYAYSALQEKGSHWYQFGNENVLSVPSALVPEERNFVLHFGRGNEKEWMQLVDLQSVDWLSRIQL